MGDGIGKTLIDYSIDWWNTLKDVVEEARDEAERLDLSHRTFIETYTNIALQFLVRASLSSNISRQEVIQKFGKAYDETCEAEAKFDDKHKKPAPPKLKLVD